MSTHLKYMPILRARQEELKVLKTFNFESGIYPCLEIIKELDRATPKPRKNSKPQAQLKKEKTFEDVYIPIIRDINAKHVFIDLPVHLNETKGMKPETLSFLRTVVAVRDVRTEYMKKFISLASKVIPVISSYHSRTGENNSITTQANELREGFNALAFRTFQNSFSRDILQIESVLTKKDYVIMDWEDIELDLEDGDQIDIVEKLKTLKCTVIIHRNQIPKGVTMTGLKHNRVVENIDNSLLEKYKDFSGSCFSDYSGIKKDGITKGGAISPGFIYYDAVKNNFHGYNSERKELEEFALTIVPAVISATPTNRMHRDPLDYLIEENIGWKLLIRIHEGIESGKSPAKFKRISMEHYLHCVKTKISNGDFEQ